MNKFIMTNGFVWAFFALVQAISITAGGDSVYTVPAQPTSKDSITFNFYSAEACCCAEFVNPKVSVADTQVNLLFSVNPTPCQVCMCAGPGEWYAFKSGPLKAGKYGIYRAQSIYCPPGTLCPQIAILPVRVGRVTVSAATEIAVSPDSKNRCATQKASARVSAMNGTMFNVSGRKIHAHTKNVSRGLYLTNNKNTLQKSEKTTLVKNGYGN